MEPNNTFEPTEISPGVVVPVRRCRSEFVGVFLDRYYWRFMNHSCEPNTLVRGQEVIASQDIEPWANVTFNYNTTEYDMAEPFGCHCGSPGCSGTIKGFKHLTAEERERLRESLAPHLRRLLRPCAEPELA